MQIEDEFIRNANKMRGRLVTKYALAFAFCLTVIEVLLGIWSYAR